MRCWPGWTPAPVLVGVDRDPEAVLEGEKLALEDARFRIRRARFDCLPELVAEEQRAIDGLLLDLGVSSPQLDDAELASFEFPARRPAGRMRMDPDSGESVADWLARAGEKQIAAMCSTSSWRRRA